VPVLRAIEAARTSHRAVADREDHGIALLEGDDLGARLTARPLFDGRAQARSQTNRLDVVVPSLVEAMFAGFPGRSGETVKITIPTKPAAS